METQFVLGRMNITKNSGKNINMVKARNTVPAPIVENKVGINDGMIDAKTQCVELPKDCPDARR